MSLYITYGSFCQFRGLNYHFSPFKKYIISWIWTTISCYGYSILKIVFNSKGAVAWNRHLQKWRHKWLSDSNVNNNTLKWNLTFSLKLQCRVTLSFQRSRRLRAHWSSAAAHLFHSLLICSLLETEKISVMVKFCRHEFDDIYQNTLVFNQQFGACIFCSHMNIDAKKPQETKTM